jgi:hypothetical protein
VFNFRIHCFHATNQITSRFGFRQGLRQRSVSREALGPRMRLIKKRVRAMFSFEYIAPFWYQQEAQEPGFLIRKDRRGNLCIQRGETLLTKYTAKYPDLPTY